MTKRTPRSSRGQSPRAITGEGGAADGGATRRVGRGAAAGGVHLAGRRADEALAHRLHAAAIRLLRRLRAEDSASGLSAPRLSALSVLVFAGPHTIGELAAAEQVRPPTISRLVQELEREGLVRRQRDSGDRRVQRVRATAAGRALLTAGRRRRVERLAASLAALSATERSALDRALPALERLADSATAAGGRGR